MIIDSIDNLTLNQYSYLDLLNELEVCKTKALIKLKKEDENVKNFIESKLYLVLKSNLIKTNKIYDEKLEDAISLLKKKNVEDEAFDKLLNKVYSLIAL